MVSYGRTGAGPAKALDLFKNRRSRAQTTRKPGPEKALSLFRSKDKAKGGAVLKGRHSREVIPGLPLYGGAGLRGDPTNEPLTKSPRHIAARADNAEARRVARVAANASRQNRVSPPPSPAPTPGAVSALDPRIASRVAASRAHSPEPRDPRDVRRAREGAVPASQAGLPPELEVLRGLSQNDVRRIVALHQDHEQIIFDLERLKVECAELRDACAYENDRHIYLTGTVAQLRERLLEIGGDGPMISKLNKKPLLAAFKTHVLDAHGIDGEELGDDNEEEEEDDDDEGDDDEGGED